MPREGERVDARFFHVHADMPASLRAVADDVRLFAREPSDRFRVDRHARHVGSERENEKIRVLSALCQRVSKLSPSAGRTISSSIFPSFCSLCRGREHGIVFRRRGHDAGARGNAAEQDDIERLRAVFREDDAIGAITAEKPAQKFSAREHVERGVYRQAVTAAAGVDRAVLNAGICRENRRRAAFFAPSQALVK